MSAAGSATRWAVVVILAFVVQIGIVTHIKIFGVVPDTLVVLAVAAGLSAGPQRGAVAGFWLGLLFDSMRPQHPVGLSSMAYGLIAFAAGFLQIAVLRSDRLMSMLIVAVGSVLGVGLYAVELEIFGGSALTNPDLIPILIVTFFVGLILSRPALWFAGLAAGPDVRSVAE